MSVQAAEHPAIAVHAAPGLIHPVWVRVTHWINALAMLMMIGSGWQIYDASPLFGFTFPHQIALGNWLAGALLWHFAAMWLLVINGIVYVTLGSRPAASAASCFRSIRARCCTICLPRCAGISRMTIFRCTTRCRSFSISAFSSTGVVIVLSGLSIWKPVQFHLLTSFFGGYNTARYVHFAAMTAIVAFLVVHVLLAVLVPKTLRAMILGR